MTLQDIQTAVRDGSQITLKTLEGSFRGRPRISWKKREIVLTQDNMCKSVLSFDDIDGF